MAFPGTSEFSGDPSADGADETREADDDVRGLEALDDLFSAPSTSCLLGVAMSELHYSIYVVLLNIDGRDAYYVGMTGLTPEERFKRHKVGIQAGEGWVRRYGVRLLPELYERLNPMFYEEAVKKEPELSTELRRRGWEVYGGH